MKSLDYVIEELKNVPADSWGAGIAINTWRPDVRPVTRMTGSKMHAKVI